MSYSTNMAYTVSQIANRKLLCVVPVQWHVPPSIKGCHSGRADAVQAAVALGFGLCTTAHRACSEQQMQGQTHGHSSKGNSVLE